MRLFSTDTDRHLAEALTAIDYANPFRPERVALERTVLGERYREVGEARALAPDGEGNPNAAGLLAAAEGLLVRGLSALDEARGTPPPAELHLLQGLALFVLYYRFEAPLARLAERAFRPSPRAARLDVPWYDDYRAQAEALLRPRGRRLPDDLAPEHLLALYFQIARAYRQIFSNILGTSGAAVGLRAAVWESIFSHDVQRYQRSLYRCMADLATLVTGPSGTGKELVARAIACSGYIPFDEREGAFPLDPDGLFLALNLTALSPQLVESELFGHRRGAFTGALEDRSGWFEVCPRHGAVFLDEIGEVDVSIQVKLLRVLQTRTFQRLGDTTPRRFHGKLVSATNRDLGAEMAAGRFREDLYYRICSDLVETPSLAEMVRGSTEELRGLALFVAQRLVGDEAEALADEVVEEVASALGPDYEWPGNFRELEQCVRNVLLRRRYAPRARVPSRTSVRERLRDEFADAELEAEVMLRRYCTLAYERVGTYEGAARVLGLDRRTVRAKVDPDLLAELQGVSSGRRPAPRTGPGRYTAPR